MSRALALLIAAAAWLLMGSSCQRTAIREAPGVLEVTRRDYVPIPSDLTATHPITEGPLSQCPMVAAQRKAEIEACNAQLEQIRQVQGTRVEDSR